MNPIMVASELAFAVWLGGMWISHEMGERDTHKLIFWPLYWWRK